MRREPVRDQTDDQGEGEQVEEQRAPSKKERKRAAQRDKRSRFRGECRRLVSKGRRIRAREVTDLCKRAGKLGALVDLSGGNLAGTKLKGMDLGRVILTGADLQRADLRGANLKGARLDGADLSGANLVGAKLNSERDLLRCQLSEATTMPNGTPYRQPQRQAPAVPQIPLPPTPGQVPQIPLPPTPQQVPQMPLPPTPQQVPQIPLPPTPGQVSQTSLPATPGPAPQGQSQGDGGPPSGFGQQGGPPVGFQGQLRSSSAPVGYSELSSALMAAGLSGLSLAQAEAAVVARGGDPKAVIAHARAEKSVFDHPGVPGLLIQRMHMFNELASLERERLDRNTPEDRQSVEAKLTGALKDFGVPVEASVVVDHALVFGYLKEVGGKLTSAGLSQRLHAEHGKAKGPSGRLQGTQDEGKWVTVGMHDHHRDEEQQGVQYFDENQRQDHVLTLSGGKFVDASGGLASGPDMSQMGDEQVWMSNPAAATQMRNAMLRKRGFTEEQIAGVNNGQQLQDPAMAKKSRQASLDVVAQMRNSPRLVFVMSSDGVFYATQGKQGVIHHSSFLGGASVAAGGELGLTNGEPTFISNESGHYQPGPALLWQAVKQMADNGVDVAQLRVQLHGCPEISGAAFLNNFNPTSTDPNFALSFDAEQAVRQVNARVQKLNLS